MLRKDFWYDLPKELIAQEPADPRDAARLMVLDRQNDSIVHSVFHDRPPGLAKRATCWSSTTPRCCPPV